MLNNNLPKILYNADQVRELDRLAISDYDVSGIMLMKRAGRASYNYLLDRWHDKAITIFCGAGNNAGDGYIVAALAKAQNFTVKVVFLSEPTKLTGDAMLAYEYAKKASVPMEAFSENVDVPEGVIIDALLGTGLKGVIRESYAKAITLINHSHFPVLAIDIPSGLSADTGSATDDVVHADATITFIGLKQGLFTGQGPDVCGDIIYDDLNIPKDVFNKINSSVRRMSFHDFSPWFSPRSQLSHKGHFGHVLVIGGDFGFGGAVAMAAEAALRVGAGLVGVATRAQHLSALLARRPELMVNGIEESTGLDKLLASASVLVVGPGLGQSDWSIELLQKAIASGLPMVIDADGLNLVATQKVALENKGKNRNPNWIMTPHPGEAARLLNTNTLEIQLDRFAAVKQLHEAFGCSVMLKGAGSLVCNQPDCISICDAGNPGMASGGMGDVLSGVIGGLIAQGLPLNEALEAGVCLHSTAADKAAISYERGLLATDLFDPLRQLVNAYQTS